MAGSSVRCVIYRLIQHKTHANGRGSSYLKRNSSDIRTCESSKNRTPIAVPPTAIYPIATPPTAASRPIAAPPKETIPIARPPTLANPTDAPPKEKSPKARPPNDITPTEMSPIAINPLANPLFSVLSGLGPIAILTIGRLNIFLLDSYLTPLLPPSIRSLSESINFATRECRQLATFAYFIVIVAAKPVSSVLNKALSKDDSPLFHLPLNPYGSFRNINSGPYRVTADVLV